MRNFITIGFRRGMGIYMTLKRIGLALLIIFIVSINYLASGLEKKELLELDYNGGTTYFAKYSLKGLDILTARQNRSILANITDITAKKLELTGILKSKDVEYAIVAFQDSIKLYAPSGELKAQYKPGDSEGEIISCCISDIDGDSYEDLLVIEGEGKVFYGNRLLILSYDNGLKRLYEREFQELNPWKVQTCDVDGDNRREISLGVYKEAAFHPVMAKRPFLYHWNGEDIVPMWRGSRLSRPFDDYIFSDLDSDGKDEIVAIERLQDGKALINAYKWAGFGFESIAESTPYEDILTLNTQYDGRESLLVQVKEGGQQFWIELEKINERLIEKTKFNKIIHIKK
ncbi:MAG TPA: hypothetical protein VEG39_05825 [Clostridia bacterium]|nr:hypothetical protein [Clostridia bacterium]